MDATHKQTMEERAIIAQFHIAANADKQGRYALGSASRNTVAMVALAVAWIEKNHGKSTRGVQPHVRMLDYRYDDGTIGEFQSNGRKGVAVPLTDQHFGKVWWLQLNGQEPNDTNFSTVGLTGADGRIVCELHYVDSPKSDLGPTPQQLLNDGSASRWLKEALATALKRDPVDAANDAKVLAEILAQNARWVSLQSK